MRGNDTLYERAIDAIEDIRSDDSVSIEITLDRLVNLRAEIETLIDAIESDVGEG